METLHITIDNFDDYVSDHGEKDQLWREYKFCRALFVLPKRSTCEVVFHGFYVSKASSEDFKDEILVSDMNYFGRQLSE